MKLSLLSLLILSCGAINSVAATIDPPQPKPGWWELRTTSGDKTATARMCTTAAEAAQSKQMMDDYNRKNCSKNETLHEGSQWITETVCKVGDSTMSGHTLLVFDGDNAYHTESTATYDPPFQGRARKSMVMDAKWLDTCKAGRMPEVVK